MNGMMIDTAAKFREGAFEGVELSPWGYVRLQRGREGCWTSPVYSVDGVTKLVASWSADAPRGTSLEVQARVCLESGWSAWLSWGEWSPYRDRRSLSAAEGPAAMDTDTLLVKKGAAFCVQLRVYLRAQQKGLSPQLRLLCFSSPAGKDRDEAIPQKVLKAPSYSQSIRQPEIGWCICSAVTMTVLMNRLGENLLPEETAHLCCDRAYGFGNWPYSAAAAGARGFRAWAAYASLGELRREISDGYAVGISVRYTNDPNDGELPYLEGTTGRTAGHLIALCGFESEGGREYAVVRDSYSPDNGGAARRYPLDQLLQAWGGVAYIVRERQPEAGYAAPGCRRGVVRPAGEGRFRLYGEGGEELRLPPVGGRGEACTGTLAAALQIRGQAPSTLAACPMVYLAAEADGSFRWSREQIPEELRAACGGAVLCAVCETGGSVHAQLPMP